MLALDLELHKSPTDSKLQEILSYIVKKSISFQILFELGQTYKSEWKRNQFFPKKSFFICITLFFKTSNFFYNLMKNTCTNRQYNEKSSNTKETKLVIVVGLLAVAVIALVATLTIQMAVFRKEEYKEMCQSEECINTGIIIFVA